MHIGISFIQFFPVNFFACNYMSAICVEKLMHYFFLTFNIVTYRLQAEICDCLIRQICKLFENLATALVPFCNIIVICEFVEP